MNKKILIYILLVAALGTGGVLMAMNGKDAVSMAAQDKNTLLTADTVNASFLGVSGRVQAIQVQEEQQVKKGDVLISLDPVDLDLQIDKLVTDIAQADVKINQARDGLKVQSSKITAAEKQAQLDIQAAQSAENLLNQGTRSEDIKRQRLAIDAAKQSAEASRTAVTTAKQNVKVAQKAVISKQQSLELLQTNYNRMKSLNDSGAATQADLDNIKNQLDGATIARDTAQEQVQIASNQVIAAEKQVDIAQNGVSQQQTALEKMQAGATSEEREMARVKTDKAKEALSQTTQTRDDVSNGQYNVDLLVKQKQSLEVQLTSLKVQRERTVLTAPADGKITRVVPKIGEIVGSGTPAVVIETNQLYYDIFVDESSIAQFKEGSAVTSHMVALNKDIQGKVKYVTSAPQYTNMRMSRDKGQSDTSSFQVRVNVQRTSELLPGMTVEVSTK